MVSPELLRRYPFFGPFNDEELKSIAKIADEETVEAGTELFEECEPANFLFLLLEGSVELFYKSEEEFHPKTSREFSVGDINPGEIFAISSVINPYVLNATARSTRPSSYIKIDAKEFRTMLDENPKMGYIAMHQVTKAIMERLAFTRVQLAAAWA
jgi:CRP/FNR family transcriptional activator FtrB